MKLLFFICSFIVFCSTAQAIEFKTAYPETLDFVTKQWKVGYKNENADSKIVEYVLSGESVDNWTELLTIQTFKFTLPKSVTPQVFADKEIENLKLKGYQYVNSTLESTPNEILIEFRVTSPASAQQDEIQRLIKTSDDRYSIFHYAIRRSDMGEEQRLKVTSALKAIN